MSYTKLRGGQLTQLEKTSLTGALHSDTRGVINTPMVTATALDAVAGPLSSLGDLLHMIDINVPQIMLGDGRFAFGPIGKTKYHKSLLNQEWNPEVINNTGKKPLAKLGIGLATVAALYFLARMVAPQALRTTPLALGIGARATPGIVRHHRVMSNIDDVGEIAAAPVIQNSAAMQVGMQGLLKGLADNDSDQLRRALKVLQGTQ